MSDESFASVWDAIADTPAEAEEHAPAVGADDGVGTAHQGPGVVSGGSRPPDCMSTCR
jgi:hypothetical protein